MPGLNGVEAMARVAAELPSVRVIILSMHSHEEYVLQAFKAGACGYILTRSAEEQLSRAILAVMRGETYLCLMISEKLERERLKPLRDREPSPGRLTERQRTILQFIAEGKTTEEAAFLLNVSAKTIEFHRATDETIEDPRRAGAGPPCHAHRVDSSRIARLALKNLPLLRPAEL